MLQLKHHKVSQLILVFLLLFTATRAQEISVKATLDSTMMIIGSQSKLTLELTKPADADVSFPLILDTIVTNVEVLSQSDIDTALVGNNRQHLTQELVITSFDSGFYYMPPFEFEIQANSGGGTLKTDPLVMRIYTYQIDSITGIFNLKPVKDIPYKFKEFVPYIVTILIIDLLVAIGVLIWMVFVKKKKIFVAPPKPKEPPYITAFRDLERIREQKLWQKEKEKEYFTELTDTLRTYIEGRFDTLAMEQTTDEILTDIKDLVSKEHYQHIESILRLSDLVKFAKMKPLMDESEKSLQQVFNFVDQTKYVPKAEDEDEEGEATTEDTTEQEKA